MAKKNSRVRVKFICRAGHDHPFIGIEVSRGVPPTLRWPDEEGSGIVKGGAPSACSLPRDAAERVERSLRDSLEHWKRLGYVELRA